MSFNGHGKNCVLLFVEGKEFIDSAIEHGKYKVEIWSLFAKQRDSNSGVVIEGVGLYVVEQVLKVFVSS